jgi:hypothetical protein
MKKILIALTLLLLTGTAAQTKEYQWKFFMPAIDNRETAVAVYEVLDNVHGVYDVVPDVVFNSVMFFFDDDKTNEEIAEKALLDAGFVIEKKMLLEEPKGGLMN